jgi:PAS domain S-box-containing protein
MCRLLLRAYGGHAKGIVVAMLFAVVLPISHILSPLETPLFEELVRSLMFVVVGISVGLLNEKRYMLENKLRKYSISLEQRVNEQTSEVRELQEKQRAMLDAISDTIVVLDDNLIILWSNKITEDQYGSILGRKCYETFKNVKEPCLDCIARKTFADGLSKSSEEEAIMKDGRPINFIVSCSPIRDSQGEIISVVEVFHDITERKKNQDKLKKYQEHLEELVKKRTNKLEERTEELKNNNLKLQELDSLKSMFIASMSHELRTPLNSIIGFTGIILQGMSGEINVEQRKQLTLVKNSANHLLSLINDVIDISKIEAGKVEIIIEKFDLSLLSQEIKDIFTIAADKKGLELSLEVPPTLLIESDKRRIKQILVNFISNAIKFTDRGEIKIKIVKKDKMVEILVRDTGIGIRKEDMDKLFKTFSQINIQGNKEEGTGLGLYLSKKIADLLGGNIMTESEFGKGSVFTLILPLKYKETKI